MSRFDVPVAADRHQMLAADTYFLGLVMRMDGGAVVNVRACVVNKSAPGRVVSSFATADVDCTPEAFARWLQATFRWYDKLEIVADGETWCPSAFAEYVASEFPRGIRRGGGGGGGGRPVFVRDVHTWLARTIFGKTGMPLLLACREAREQVHAAERHCKKPARRWYQRAEYAAWLAAECDTAIDAMLAAADDAVCGHSEDESDTE